LSFGPIAAFARPAIPATVADPVKLRKSRRENLLMATLPQYDFCEGMMRRVAP
jgi:hypothetical protein